MNKELKYMIITFFAGVAVSFIAKLIIFRLTGLI